MKIKEFHKIIIAFMKKLDMFEKALCINDIKIYSPDIPEDIIEELQDVLKFHRKEYEKAEKNLVDAITPILLGGAGSQRKYFGCVFEEYNRDGAAESERKTKQFLYFSFQECDYFTPLIRTNKGDLCSLFLRKFREIMTQ